MISFRSLFLHSSPVAYWVPTNLGISCFSVISFCLFILLEGTIKTLCTPELRKNVQSPHKRLTHNCLWMSKSLQQRRESAVFCCTVRGTEWGSVCRGLFEGGCHYIHYLHYSLIRSEEGTQPHPSKENCIKVLLSMSPPIRTRPSFPYSQSLLTVASISLLSLPFIGQTEWKPQSQRTIQIDHVDHSLV